MSSEREQLQREDIPDAIVKKRRRISVIWLVPLIAAIIGAWVAWKTISEQGPLVTVYFKTAAGLVAGKTKVKYKDVDVGQVESITLSKEDLSKVIVKIRMAANSEQFLTENTRFWVVRARIRAGDVSGLSTLLSGAYIGIDPVRNGKQSTSFVGLDEAPPVTTDQPGRHFRLKAETRSSLEIGSPVYFRQIKVGEVVEYALSKNGGGVDIRVFIDAPHDALITEETRFWDVGGIDVDLSAEGIRIDTVSMVSLMIGGLAFSVPENQEAGSPVDEEHEFPLFASRADSLKPEINIRRKYLVSFDGSVRGLTIGSPVEFRGIPLGQVTDIDIEAKPGEGLIKIPVTVELEPERIVESEEVGTDEEAYAALERLVANGLRAQLKSGNLLTGQLYVDLDFYPEAKPAKVLYNGKYPQVPTIPTKFDEMARSINNVLDKLERMPLDEIGENLNKTIIQADATLDAVNSVISPDAPVIQELQATMTELSEAARSLRVLADYLERNPEALIRGKQE